MIVADYGLVSVSLAYDRHPVLQNYSLMLKPGITCLMGASGCGKTTVLRLLAGLVKPDAGTVLSAPRTAVQFQEDRLLPWYTALENVMLVMKGEDRREKAAQQLAQLGLAEADWQKRPEAMSGGMCRRVALARALCYEAPLLLLDEPTRGLDEATREKVTGKLVEAVGREKQYCLWITHDPREAEQVADWPVLLQPLVFHEND